MEIVVGTYDEIVLGFRLIPIAEAFQLEASFSDHSHSGCVKCIAVSRKGVVASGGTDETIRLLNIKKNRELGSLMEHKGSVTSLLFHKNFMFSSSEDGTFCLWKTFTWECLRTFKAHEGGVYSVSVHPSGKLALTVGKDRKLHTWNLMTGRSAYITNIKQVADLVRWSSDGDQYVIVTNNQIDVYSVETAEVTSHIVMEQGRISCVEFLNNDVLLYGGEGGVVHFYDVQKKKLLHSCETNTSRIKGLSITPSPTASEDKKMAMVIASSEGFIKIYNVIEKKQGKVSTKLLTEYNCGFRVTCMTVLNVAGPSNEIGGETKVVEEDIVQEAAEQTEETEDTSPTEEKRSKKNRKRKRQNLGGELEAESCSNGVKKKKTKTGEVSKVQIKQARTEGSVKHESRSGGFVEKKKKKSKKMKPKVS